MDHRSDIALFLSRRRVISHSLWLELLEIVLTWRYCRYEGAFRDRSLDLKEATTVTRYTTVQDGTQGTYHSRIVFRAFVTRRAPSPSLPLFPSASVSPASLAHDT